MIYRKISISWIVLALVTAGVLFALSLFFWKRSIADAPPPATAPRFEQAGCVPGNEIYFSNEPGSPEFSRLIVDSINAAQESLDIAVYSFKSQAIKEAIYAAYDRGVKVTLVLDYRKKGSHDSFLNDLPAGITRLDLGSAWPGSMLMHHKFALIDADSPSARLIFGSFNWTEAQEKYDRSFLFISQDQNLTASFRREFDLLASGISGRNKLAAPDYQPWDLLEKCADYSYEVWFSPSGRKGGARDRLIEMIRSADQEIMVMGWVFSDEGIAQEILDRAEEGVAVSLAIDDFNINEDFSAVPYIISEAKKRGLENLAIVSSLPAESDETAVIGAEPPNSFLHQHALVVDGKAAFIGTNNWSDSGFFYNDESSIVTSDPVIVSSLLSSFRYNFDHGRPVR